MRALDSLAGVDRIKFQTARANVARACLPIFGGWIAIGHSRNMPLLTELGNIFWTGFYKDTAPGGAKQVSVSQFMCLDHFFPVRTNRMRSSQGATANFAFYFARYFQQSAFTINCW